MERMHLKDVRNVLRDEYGIPERTFQWYLSEDLIPQPQYEGREGYYDLEKIEIVHFVCALRVMNREFDIPLKKASEILRRYEKNLKLLVDYLGGLAEEYPTTRFPLAMELSGMDQLDLSGRSVRNRSVRRWFFSELEKGIDLKKLSPLRIEEEIKKHS